MKEGGNLSDRSIRWVWKHIYTRKRCSLLLKNSYEHRGRNVRQQYFIGFYTWNTRQQKNVNTTFTVVSASQLKPKNKKQKPQKNWSTFLEVWRKTSLYLSVVSSSKQTGQLVSLWRLYIQNYNHVDPKEKGKPQSWAWNCLVSSTVGFGELSFWIFSFCVSHVTPSPTF